jgi:hypothetical protein
VLLGPCRRRIPSQDDGWVVGNNPPINTSKQDWYYRTLEATVDNMTCWERSETLESWATQPEVDHTTKYWSAMFAKRHQNEYPFNVRVR